MYPGESCPPSHVLLYIPAEASMQYNNPSITPILSLLQRLEGCLGLLIPGERVAAQKTRQGRRDDVEALDELPVVARQAQETSEALGGLRLTLSESMATPSLEMTWPR